MFGECLSLISPFSKIRALSTIAQNISLNLLRRLSPRLARADQPDPLLCKTHHEEGFPMTALTRSSLEYDADNRIDLAGIMRTAYDHKALIISITGFSLHWACSMP